MSLLSMIPIVGGLADKWLGNRAKRDQYAAEAFSSVHSQFGREFRENRNWFDSLVDGLNRLPRPFFAFGTIYLFVMCWREPEKFAQGAKNLVLVPYEMWWILGTIIVFFFGGRINKEFGKYKINTKMLEKFSSPSAGFKSQKRTPLENPEQDPQEGIEWEERREKRYKTDWSNLND